MDDRRVQAPSGRRATDDGVIAVLWDPAPLLVKAAVGLCAMLVIFVCAIIVLQIVMTADHKPTTEVWAALTGAIGTIFGILGTVYAYRFNSTKQSVEKDHTIAQQARTAAVIAKTAETVAATGPKSGGDKTITTDDVHVTARTASVTSETTPTTGAKP